MKKIVKKYKHIWTLLYVFIYLPWFMYLEKNVTTVYRVMHTRLDDIIPFCEYFIIPYLLWFAYIPAVFIFFFFKSREEYYKLSANLFVGMSIALLICTLFPNGQDLRTYVDPDKNMFTYIVSTLYKGDTNTNVFPSIHVFNSVGACLALYKSKCIKHRKPVLFLASLLTSLIVLSTMFLKQHSFLDVIGGMLLAGIMYIFVYVLQYQPNKKAYKEKEDLA